jgi:hypothetical protein
VIYLKQWLGFFQVESHLSGGMMANYFSFFSSEAGQFVRLISLQIGTDEIILNF